MFGGKKPQLNPLDRPEVEPEWEYYVFAALGVNGFNEQANQLAQHGWELVNGCMAGTVNYGYMRRRVSGP